MVRARIIGEISYRDIPPDLRWDVALCITDAVEKVFRARRILPDDFRTGLVMKLLEELDSKINIVSVDPALLKACPRMTGRYHTGTVFKYEQAYRRGEEFPPIVINSKVRRGPLCEGAHRACAAEKAGIPEIPALDIASIDLEPLVDYYEDNSQN